MNKTIDPTLKAFALPWQMEDDCQTVINALVGARTIQLCMTAQLDCTADERIKIADLIIKAAASRETTGAIGCLETEIETIHEVIKEGNE